MIGHATLSSIIDTARTRWRVPAIGALVVDADGATTAVAGVRRRGGDDHVRADDAWHIGSCGKSMTAALFARLVERGDAQWGTPLTALLPDHGAHAEWSAVTIDELLVHRAGVREVTRDELVSAYADQRPAADQRRDLVAAALAQAPDGRGRFQYSNRGYAIAGAAIERITGMPFEDALRMHLLDPLGMADAGFGPPPAIAGHGGRLRVGSVVLGRGGAVAPESAGSDNPAVLTPAGRLHVRLADWARFLRLFLVPAQDAVLTASSVDRLLAAPPASPGETTLQTMGWAPADGYGGSFGQQGSNTYWVATALLDRDRRRAAAVVVDDGRTRLFGRTARLAAQLLAEREN